MDNPLPVLDSTADYMLAVSPEWDIGGVDVGVSKLLGSNIAKNQADVEVVAMTMRDTPLTADAFKEMLVGSNDWLSLQVCVLGCGPPGFSKVPYNSSNVKKKGETDTSRLPVYTVYPESDSISSGLTRFHTYKKGKQNKDRGERVDTFDSNDDSEHTQTIDASCAIPGATTMSFFLREDAFKADKPTIVDNRAVANNTVLPKNTFVFAQLASANINQAKEGYIIKLKKLVVVDEIPSLILMSCFKQPHFPAGIDASKHLQTAVKEMFPVMRKALYSGNSSIYNLALEQQWFAACNKTNSKTHLVNPKTFEEYFVPSAMLMKQTRASSLDRAIKILNLSIAADAVHVVVRSAERKDNVATAEDEDEHVVVFIDIDFDKMLSLRKLSKALSLFDCDHEIDKDIDVKIAEDSGNLIWSDTSVFFNDSDFCDNNTKRIVYELGKFPVSLESPVINEAISSFVSDGKIGFFHPLRIHIMDKKDMQNFYESGFSLKNKIQVLQICPQMKNTLSAPAFVNKKRKRPDMSLDSIDDI